LPTCYAPVRRAPTPVLLQGLRTRLACVKHAASVRSEPGSNSRLKPVAWAIKMPRFAPRPAYPSKLLSLELLNPSALAYCKQARKPGWFRTDSGTSYRLSKSDRPPCPAERLTYILSMSMGEEKVNSVLTISTGNSTGQRGGAIGSGRGSLRGYRLPSPATEGPVADMPGGSLSNNLAFPTNLKFPGTGETICGRRSQG
jgi:hypothetical protein